MFTIPNVGPIYANHTYVVQAALDNDGNGVTDHFTVYNPWGAGYGIDIPVPWLSEAVETVYTVGPL